MLLLWFIKPPSFRSLYLLRLSSCGYESNSPLLVSLVWILVSGYKRQLWQYRYHFFLKILCFYDLFGKIYSKTLLENGGAERVQNEKLLQRSLSFQPTRSSVNICTICWCWPKASRSPPSGCFYHLPSCLSISYIISIFPYLSNFMNHKLFISTYPQIKEKAAQEISSHCTELVLLSINQWSTL